METIVIMFLLVVGALCILAQAAVTVYRQREAAAAAAERARAAEPKPSARTRSASASAKSSSAKGAKGASASAADDASDESDDDPSSADTMLRSVAGVLGERTPAGAQLGLLGVALMLIAVLMVLDVAVSFSFAT